MKCPYCDKNFNYVGNIRNYQIVCPYCKSKIITTTYDYEWETKENYSPQ